MRTFIVIFQSIIVFVFSLIPNWKLKDTSVDLLGSEDSCNYNIVTKEMYNMKATLKKIYNKKHNRWTNYNKSL